MKTVKVAEAHCIRVRDFRNYKADVLIVDGSIVRIIYDTMPGIGWQCMIRENQDLWFDDLLLQQNEKVRYEPKNSATKYLDCDLRKDSEEEFEDKSKRAILFSDNDNLRDFYDHLSDGPLKDYAKEQHERQIEKLKKKLGELQAW